MLCFSGLLRHALPSAWPMWYLLLRADLSDASVNADAHIALQFTHIAQQLSFGAEFRTTRCSPLQLRDTGLTCNSAMGVSNK